MIPPEQYKKLFEESSVGGRGTFGLQILVAGSDLPANLFSRDQDSRIWKAVHDAHKAIQFAIRTSAAEQNPKCQEERQANRDEIPNCFPAEDLPIFVEEIPNGYCNDWCCTHLPWFIVTTRFGRIKIGWRKRVIAIDWSELPVTKIPLPKGEWDKDKHFMAAETLFPLEDVTKNHFDIHAWSLEKAAEYLRKILQAAGAPTTPNE